MSFESKSNKEKNTEFKNSVETSFDFCSLLLKDINQENDKIFGFIPIKISNIDETFIFDSIKSSFSDFSNDVFYYYKSKRNYNLNVNKEKELNEMFLENLSTCHNIINVNNKLISKDPLDILLFKKTKWQIYKLNDKINEDIIATFVKPSQEINIEEKIEKISEKYNQLNSQIKHSDNEQEEILQNHYELGIIRNFHCDDKKYLKTVIVKDINDSYYKIFCKGNPFIIQDLCKPNTIPINYKEKVNQYIQKGKVIIALSGKRMKMNYFQSQLIERKKCEENLIFLGLVIMNNNKPLIKVK